MGFDPDNEYDVVRYMESIPKALGRFDPTEFDKWAKRVEDTAREFCNDPRGNRVRFIVTHSSKASWIDIPDYDKTVLECVIAAIRRLSMSMPEPLFAWYNGWQALLTIRKSKLRN